MSGIWRVILILLYAGLCVNDDLKPLETLEMTVPTFGEVHLSWKPCPASNSTQDIKYFVNISTPDYDEQYYTQRCNSSRILALHRGLHAQVSITKWNQGVQLSLSVPLSKVLRPTGEEGTAATNLSCLIHTRESLNISLTCNWTAGAKAPLDTQYYLYYRCVEAPADAVSFIVPSRFGNKAEKCHEYVTERGGQRHTGCYVPSSYIELFGLKDQILVLINGSSRTREIQSIDHVYETSSIEVLNPPRDVSLRKENGTQILVWKNPHSTLSDTCLHYEVRVWDLWNNNERTYTVRITMFRNEPLQEPWTKHSLQVRALATEDCMERVLYSEWSKPLYIDLISSKIYVITACTCLLLAGLAVLHLCLRFHVWRQIFPPIPKPKKETFLSAQHDPACLDDEFDRSWSFTEVISYIEEVN